MTRYIFRDFYGCEAQVTEYDDGTARAIVYSNRGIIFHDKFYSSFRGARIAIGKMSDGTAKLIRKKEVQ